MDSLVLFSVAFCWEVHKIKNTNPKLSKGCFSPKLKKILRKMEHLNVT